MGPTLVYDLEAELLGGERPLKITEEEDKKGQKCLKLAEETVNHSIVDIKIASRRRRVFELRCLGLKIPQIVEKMAEEGQLWSESTIKGDLRSDAALEFLEELQRQQLVDIALAKSRKLKLEYRDRMIERFWPRKSPEALFNVTNVVQMEQDVTINLLLERYQQFKRERNQGSAVCSNDSDKRVDTTGTHS